MTWDYLDAQKGARQTLFLSQKCRRGPETITFEEREREKIVSNTKHIRRKPPN
jgi:hypothetical protein